MYAILLQPDKSFCKFGYEAIKKYSELVDEENHHGWHYFEKFKMTLYAEKVYDFFSYRRSLMFV